MKTILPLVGIVMASALSSGICLPRTPAQVPPLALAPSEAVPLAKTACDSARSNVVRQLTSLAGRQVNTKELQAFRTSMTNSLATLERQNIPSIVSNASAVAQGYITNALARDVADPMIRASRDRVVRTLREKTILLEDVRGEYEVLVARMRALVAKIQKWMDFAEQLAPVLPADECSRQVRDLVLAERSDWIDEPLRGIDGVVASEAPVTVRPVPAVSQVPDVTVSLRLAMEAVSNGWDFSTAVFSSVPRKGFCGRVQRLWDQTLLESAPGIQTAVQRFLQDRLVFMAEELALVKLAARGVRSPGEVRAVRHEFLSLIRDVERITGPKVQQNARLGEIVVSWKGQEPRQPTADEASGRAVSMTRKTKGGGL